MVEIELVKRLTPYLHLEREVFFHVFDDHDQKGKFDTKCFSLISRTADVCCANQQNTIIKR